jgi:excinuclease UvrABC ATPase subunit
MSTHKRTTSKTAVAPPRTSVAVQGARVHNLRNISVEIPRDKLVVITGLSGSGESSLAFDTIYAEHQRRYMEPLSSAKRFIAQVSKPDVAFVYGLSPVISIEQKTIAKNPRSTIGTMTDIASYLNLLFSARVKASSQPSCTLCRMSKCRAGLARVHGSTARHARQNDRRCLADLAVIKTADHVIDLRPEGGHAGGEVVVTGTPEMVAACRASHTGRFLKTHLKA